MSATAAVSFVTSLTAERAREETVLSDAVTFEAAFRREYEQRYDPLARYLARLTGDSAAASDLAQETFVRLFGRGSMPDDPAAWLVSVAHNLLRNEGQQITRRLRLLERHAGELVPHQAAASAHDALETDERRMHVRRALDTLAERDRQMLLLRYEGFSYREIARALAINEGSIGTLLTRAKTAFREALRGERGTDAEDASATD